MKTVVVLCIFLLSTLFYSCTEKIEYGQFTESECPFPIPNELVISGKFSYGYMTVPEFHNTEGSQAIEELNESPEMISVSLRGNVETYNIALNGNRISVWLFGQMYWNTQPPLSIHKIINRDYSEIIDNPGVIFPLESFSNGSFWSLVMNGWPDHKPEQLPSDSEYHPFIEGAKTMVFGSYFTKEIRDIWQVEYKPGRLKSMATNVPILMLNGAEDHLCSPRRAQELSDLFENSYCYIFNGHAHSPIDAGDCGIMLMKQFLKNPIMEPDASCLEMFTGEQTYVLP